MPIGWLKEDATTNIKRILDTLLVSQPLISWLKAVTKANISLILFTLLTFQELMSPLKAVFSKNALDISVTWLTSQSGIEPYSLSEHRPSSGFVLKQVFIASWKLASVIGVFGQVPQTGILFSDNGEFVLKSDGSEVIFETHQFDISWLKADASKNIPPISVTLLTSQELISWLKDDAW